MEYKKRYVDVSNHFIDFFKSKKSIDAEFSEKMQEITAMYINKSEDQLVLKRSCTPNIVRNPHIEFLKNLQFLCGIKGLVSLSVQFFTWI